MKRWFPYVFWGLFLLWCLVHYSGVKGYVAARMDLAAGHLELRTYGLPAPWRKVYSRLLHAGLMCH